MRRPRIRAAWTAALVIALVPGCGEDAPAPAAPESTALMVSLAVFGPGEDPDGFEVELRRGGPVVPIAVQSVGPEGGTVVFQELEPGGHDVAVTSVEEPCALEGDQPRPVEVGEGWGNQVELRLSCPSPGTAAAYERTSPGRYDRFYLDEDGTFLVDDGPASGSRGTYGLSDGVYVFRFDYSSSWGEDGQATGRLDGDCMSVSYGVVLGLDGYEDGRYCRLPEP